MKNFKSLKLFLTTIAFVFLFSLSVFAGTGVIQFNDPAPTRGKTFNLVIKVKSTDVRLKTADITITYNPSMLEFVEHVGTTVAEGGAGTLRVSGGGIGKGSGTKVLEYQVKFKAVAAGNTTVTVADQEVTDTTDNLVNITKLGTSSVKIAPVNKQSKNANLKSLEVRPGEISAAFDATVMTYDVEVNSDINRLDIDAQAEDSDAIVSINGNDNFAIGTNRVTIDVTAPDGKTKKQYLLNVTKNATGTTGGATTISEGAKFVSNPNYSVTIMTKPEGIEIPRGYQRLEGAFGSEQSEVYGPVDEEGEPKVILIYGRNQNDVTGFYRYDREENTLQRYVAEPNSRNYDNIVRQHDETAVKYNNISKQMAIVLPLCIGLAVISVILGILLAIVIAKNSGGKGRNNPYDSYDDEDDDDDDYFTNSRPTKILSNSNRQDDDEDENFKDDKKSNDDIEDLG